MWGCQTVPQRVGFHDGERLVQERMGVTDVADRRAGMVAAPKLDGSLAAFVADRDLVFLSARDAGATLWTSVWGGVPGFCTIRDRTLRVAATPRGDDVLAGLAVGALVGTLFVDFPRRRRVRVNGVVTGAGPGGIEIGVDQAYGNCPRYIHPRALHPPAGAHPGIRRDATRLAPEHVDQIGRADTFVLGTAHPTHGVDTSHRGGDVGFVRVESDGSLSWPDLPGNDLFNSIGNLAVDPEASLLFLDAPGDRVLQVSGRAALDWTSASHEGGDATGPTVRVWPAVVVTTDGQGWQAGGPTGSDRNGGRDAPDRSG